MHTLIHVIIWISMLALSVLYSPHLAGAFSQNNDSFGVLLLAFLLTLPIFVIATQLICHKKRWDSKGYIRLTLVVALSLLYIPTLLDDPPIENDWSEDDVVFANPDIQGSYDILVNFMYNDAELSTKFELREFEWASKQSPAKLYENIRANSAAIESCWQANKELLSQFEKLDNFEGITDLKVGEKISVSTPILSLSLVRNITRLYHCYSLLKAEQGKMNEACQIMSRIHSIGRKGLDHSCIFVDTMMWLAICHINIAAAEQLSNHPGFLEYHAKNMKEKLYPVTGNGALERSMKTEYVVMKNIVNELYGANRAIDERFPSFLWDKAFARELFFKKNRTLRRFKSFYLEQINQLERVEKFDFDFHSPTHKPERELDPGNLVGSILADIAIPSLEKNGKVMSDLIVKTQLLDLVLSEKADEKIVYSDPYTGKPFQKDEKGNLHSAGPDKKYFTDDDITLQ